jgi:23S rRNA (cytosine1962-C5)-methyltransferase
MKNLSYKSKPPPLATVWLSTRQLADFRAAGTTAHRICTAAEAWVERFGEDALVSYKSAAAREELLQGLRIWTEAEQCNFRRVFGKFIPKQNAERVSPTLLEGETGLPLETTVEEAGIRYGIDFAAGYSAGLFIDQRANRAFVQRLGAKRLLNTFAYTCSFSVVAALSGAETVSVDLSKKSLDRGRENFVLNKLEPARHQFIADDVLEVLPRLARRGERYDCIILDPPTFSRGNKGRRFQVEHDFEALLTAALEVASPGARLLLSTNCTRVRRADLERIARYGAKLSRRGGTFHREPELPDLPAGEGSQTLWLTVGG